MNSQSLSNGKSFDLIHFVFIPWSPLVFEPRWISCANTPCGTPWAWSEMPRRFKFSLKQVEMCVFLILLLLFEMVLHMFIYVV